MMQETRKLLADIIAVMIGQDFKKPRNEIYDAVSRQLGLRREDWVEVMVALSKYKFPLKIKDPETGRFKKINNRAKLERFFRNMKSAYFKILAIQSLIGMTTAAMNPVINPAKAASSATNNAQETEPKEQNEN